jgi:ABC-type branched-subunit amino acid transport system ATPase component
VEVPLQTADYLYIMHEGRIKAEGTPGDIAGSTDIREAYLGM